MGITTIEIERHYINNKLVSQKDGKILTKYLYDETGKLIKSNDGRRKVLYSYNENNLLTSENIIYTKSHVIKSINMTYEYNKKNQLIKKFCNGALACTYRYNYKGLCKSMYLANPFMCSKKFKYDKENRVIKEISYDNTVINYTYSDNNKTKTGIGKNGYRKIYMYDDHNNLIEFSYGSDYDGKYTLVKYTNIYEDI